MEKIEDFTSCLSKYNDYVGNRSYISLVHKLQANPEGLSLKELAEYLGCSERTIRNYIKSINASEDVIVANNSRYYLAADADVEKLEKQFQISTVNDIQLFIVRKLLFNASGLYIDELLNELYISEKTLERYIQNINKQINDIDLQIGQKHGKLILKGSEENKRELFKRNLRINDYSIIEKDLSNYCDAATIDYTQFKKIVRKALNDFNIYVNDYSFLNILTHLVVQVIRIKAGSDVSETESFDVSKKIPEYKCAASITKSLSERFNISINEIETDRLAKLIYYKTTPLDKISPLDADNTVNKYRDFVNDIILKIKDKFGISLEDEEFTYFLAVHISNLVNRSQNNAFNDNPLFEQVLNTDSFIYELAVFVSSELKNQFNIAILNTEIGFLAFHLGSVIVKKNLFAEEINVAVFTYDFYGFFSLLKKELEKLETSSIHFHFIDEDNAVPNLTFDILITTMFSKEKNVPCIHKVVINPMYTKKDVQSIRDAISLVEEEKNFKKADIFIDQFFNHNLFEKNVYLKSEEEYIRYMSEKLIIAGIADESFTDDVLERERYTPTSFENGIAIPHAIKGQAISNHAYAIINEKPFRWGNYDVNVIIMIALNQDGYEGFRYILDRLIDKTDDKEKLLKMSSCDDFFSFINLIKEQ
nr:PTS sugar transporter subunit IIA [Clostridia bacterium]